MRNARSWVALTTLVFIVCPAGAFDYTETFSDSAAINLTWDAHNRFTCSPTTGGTTATGAAYGSYGFYTRFDPGIANPEWIVEITHRRSVSRVDLQFFNQQSRAEQFNIYLSDDGVNWGAPVASVIGNTSDDPALLSWPARSAKFVKYQAAKLPADLWGYGHILQQVDIYGDESISYARGGGFSVLQGWNASTVQSLSGWKNGGEQTADGRTTAQWGRYTTAKPSTTFLLDDVYPIHRVGISTTGGLSRPAVVDVYASPDETGDDWIRLGQMRQIPCGFSTYDLDAPYDEEGFFARRLRYDVLFSHNPTGDNYVEEYFAYVAPLPEPGSAVVLSVGAIALAWRRATR